VTLACKRSQVVRGNLGRVNADRNSIIDAIRQLTYYLELVEVWSTFCVRSQEVSGNLGWVNAERNGVIDAIRKLTYFTTGHAFYGASSHVEHYTEDERDGRFICDVCGRSQCVLFYLCASWFRLAVPLDAFQHLLALHFSTAVT